MKNTIFNLTTLTLVFTLTLYIDASCQIAGNSSDLSTWLPLMEKGKPGDRPKTGGNPEKDEWPRCMEPRNVKIEDIKGENILTWDTQESKSSYEIELYLENEGKLVIEKSYKISKNQFKIPEAYSRSDKNIKVRIRKICISQQGSIFHSDWVVLASSVPCNLVAEIIPNMPYSCTSGTQLIAEPSGGGYRYLWNTGSNSGTITVSDTSIYSVTVTDLSNFCTSIAQKQLLSLPQVSISTQDSDHCLYNDTTIIHGTLIPSIYDSLGLTYTWYISSDGIYEWSPVVNFLPSGVTYSGQNSKSLTIQNGNTQYSPWYYKLGINLNCTNPNTIWSNVISINYIECSQNQCESNVTPQVVTCPDSPVTFVATPGTTGTTYLWSTGQTSQSIVVDPIPDETTTYTVTITCPNQTVSVREAHIIKIDNCSSKNPEVGCDFTTNFQGVKKTNNILKLNFFPGNFLVFFESMNYHNVDLIYVEVYGTNSGIDTSFREALLFNRNAHNNQSWSHDFINFGGFLTYIIKLRVIDIYGNEIKCQNDHILEFTHEIPLCLLNGGLKYRALDNESVQFSFQDPGNVNHFTEFLNTIGIEESMLNQYISSNISSIRLKLTSLMEGIPFQKEEVVVIPLSGNYSIRDFSKNISPVPLGNFFHGELQLIFVFKNNGGSRFCDTINITIGSLPEPPFVQCGEDMTNESSNLEQSNYNGSMTELMSINKLPLIILPGYSGDPQNGIYGTGIVSLPFFGIGGVLVNLNGIKINRHKKVYAGSAMAIQGFNQINFNNIPPILADNICQPPPPKSSVYVDGINPATGLDKFGFNPTTGIHDITKTKYDLNGFDINGIHKDTGQPFNNEGCTREGYIYNENANAPKVPCDPAGGTPSGLNIFLDSLYQTGLEELVIQVIDSLIVSKENSVQNCDSIRQQFNPNIIGSNPEHVFGPGEILKNDDMHLQFSERPFTLPHYSGTRNAQMIEFENNHIALYDCTKKNHSDNVWIQRLQNLKEEPLFSELIEWLKLELSSINTNELNAIKNPNILKNWIANKINTYLIENKDIGYNNPKKLNFEKYDDINDIQTASSDGLFFSNQNYAPTYKNKFYNLEEALEEIVSSNNSFNSNNASLPIVRRIFNDNFPCDFIFTNFRFFPTNSDADLFVVVENKSNTKKLVFKGTNINFTGGGVDSLASRLSLLNDVEIKLSNTAKMKIHKGNQTYLQWNCDGIHRINIKTTIDFCSNYVVGLQEDLTTVTADSILRFDVEIGFQDWLEFSIRVKGKPFYIKGYKDYPIEMDTLILDYTGTRRFNIIAPLGYTHSFYNDSTHIFDPLWKGFYLKGLKVHIPQKLFKKSDNSPTYVEALHCIFDDNGFSGILSATGLIDYNTGVIGEKEGAGWKFSLNNFHLVFLQNKIAGGGLGGEILVPKLKYPFIYRGTIISDRIICLKIENVQSDNQMPSLKGINVVLEKNTFIQGIYDFDEEKWDIMANLCGSMQIVSDSGFLSKLQIPTITFQNFRIQNTEPYLSPGYWGMGDLDGNVGFNFKGFGMSLDSIRPYGSPASPDTMFLGIFFGIQIADSTIVAKGGFDIISGFHEEENIQKWKYDGLRIRHICISSSFTELFTLAGCVEFFYDDIKYGDGWRGMVNIKLKFLEKSGTNTSNSSGNYGIESVVIFGNINNHKYWSVDLIATGSPLFTAMGLNFTGLGGGLAKGMSPDYSQIPEVIEEWDINTFLNSPIGTTITGIVYTPNVNSGFEIKLITRFEIVDKEKGHGTGELIVRLNANGGLDEIEIRAQATIIEKDIFSHFPFKSGITTALDDVSNLSVGKVNVGSALGLVNIPESLANAEAVIKGIASFKMNFRTKEFKGIIAAFMTTGTTPGDKGPISGIGPRGELCFIDIYFGPGKWYIYAGEPAMDKRMGTHLKMGNIAEIELSSYFCIGSVVPDFPPLPKEVAHLGRGLGVPKHVRNSGSGFIFGASLRMAIHANIVVASADVNMGGGFDVMFRQYKDVGCIQDNGSVEPLGINEYFAMGQLWAFLNGNVKAFGINVFKAGFAAALQFQAPNPTWVGGGLEIQVYDFKLKLKLDAGDRCRFVSDDPADLLGVDIIESLEPIDNTAKISGCEKLIVNLALNDGETHDIDLGDGNGLTPVTIKINWDSTGIFYKGYKFNCTAKLSDKQIILIPENFYPSSDSITLYAKIDVLLPTGAVFASQRKQITYYTEKLVQYVPEINVEYSYPTRGMVNFYKNEHKANIGFIKLISGQGYLFSADQPVYAKFTNPNGQSFTDEVKYISNKKTIEFRIDKEKIVNGEYYRIDFIKPGLEEQDGQFNTGEKPASGPEREAHPLYTLFFRASEYNTLGDKIAAMNSAFNNTRNHNQGGIRDVSELHFQKFENLLGEKFSHEELNSNILVFKPATGSVMEYNSLEYRLYYQTLNGICLSSTEPSTSFSKSFGPYASSFPDLYNYVTVPIAQSVNEEAFATRSINFNYPQIWFDATGFTYNNSLNRMKQDHLDFKEFCYEKQIDQYGELEEYYNKQSLELNKMIRTGSLQGSEILIKYTLPNGTTTTSFGELPFYYFKVVHEYEKEPLPIINQN